MGSLRLLHGEVSSEINWGRLVVSLSFAERVGLTEEEWELLFWGGFPGVPTLIQIREVALRKNRREKIHSGLDLNSMRK